MFRIQDRMTRGFLAGVTAGVITKVYDVLAYYLHFSTLRWMDYAGVLMYGKKPLVLGEEIFATVSVFFFHGLLGVMFVFLIQRLFSSDNLVFKGLFYSITCWFIIFSVTHLFKMPGLFLLPLKTTVSNIIGAFIWGLLVALAVQWLDNRIKP